MKAKITMRRLLLASAVALTFAAVVPQPAHATVVTFDDLAGNASSVPDGYGGFDWNNLTTVGSLNAVNSGYQSTGYGAGTVSGSNVIFNWGGTSPVGITLATAATFTYIGAFFTGAWESETVSFTGLLNGAVVDTSSAYAITTSGPQFIELDWTGINELIIANTGMQWAMDNFTFSASPVPEPASMTLLSLALGGLGLLRRRRIDGSNLAYYAL
jgi:PEP-CTERM motif